MNHSDFVKTVATYIKKYAPVYGIEVVSPIIAQAVLESGYGTSELAVNAHNYFGLKYREVVILLSKHGSGQPRNMKAVCQFLT